MKPGPPAWNEIDVRARSREEAIAIARKRFRPRGEVISVVETKPPYCETGEWWTGYRVTFKATPKDIRRGHRA